MTEAIWLGLISAVGAVITAVLQTSSKRTMGEFKHQLEDLKQAVENVTAISQKNYEEIGKVANGTRSEESCRLEEELTRAIQRGYRTHDESRRIEPVYHSYKELGGNGYIEDLHRQFLELQVKELGL